MPRYLPYVFGTLIAVLITGGPLAYAVYEQANIRNFHCVQEGVLYRSGQMSIAGLKRIVHDYGIKTVLSLRDSYRLGEAPPDLDEESYCRRQDIAYFRISPRSWWAPEGLPPAEEGVKQFRAIMDDPANYPVLVHCFAGIHRTGAFCAIYHMEYDRWSNEQAVVDLRANGYTNLDDEWDILGYLERYRPRWRGPAPAPQVTTSRKLDPATLKRKKHRKW